MTNIEEAINKFKNKLLSDNEKEAIVIELGKMQDKSAVPFLINILLDNNVWFVRDAIALSLSELKANESVPFIIDLIKKPENINNRGTLIYALHNLDCKAYILFFIELICTANFECRQMALEIVKKYANKISLSDKEMAMVELHNYEIKYNRNMDENAEELNKLAFVKKTEKLLMEGGVS